MRLASLSLRGFRNLASQVFEPGPRFDVVSGENGAGKSSLLEAIHVLGALRSFRPCKAADLVQLGAEEARLEASVEGDVAPRRLVVLQPRQGARKVAVDGKRPRSSVAFCAHMPVVAFHPGDLALAAGPPELRRAFLDGILARVEPGYAELATEYDAALRSRNRLLKEERLDRRGIAVYDALIASRGAKVGAARAAMAATLATPVCEAFEDVVGTDAPFEVRYEAKVAPDEALLARALAESLERDRARGYTSVGPHADDLVLALSRASARTHASQGQHRVMSLALKLAELSCLSLALDRAPLFLLDDVSSELDRTRQARLFRRIAASGSQVLLTTTHRELIPLEEGRVDHVVEAGRVRRLPG